MLVPSDKSVALFSPKFCQTYLVTAGILTYDAVTLQTYINSKNIFVLSHKFIHSQSNDSNGFHTFSRQIQ